MTDGSSQHATPHLAGLNGDDRGQLSRGEDHLLVTARPRFPWVGGDLQTLRSVLVRPAQIDAGSRHRISVTMDDGTGDTLTGELCRPRAAGEPKAVAADCSDPGRPLVVLFHGLGGCFDSPYMRATTAALLEEGYAVLRMSMRGAHPGGAPSAGMYHAGRADDALSVLDGLARDVIGDGAAAHGIVAVGFSLGGNVLLNLFAPSRIARLTAALRGAMTVSAPIDPARAVQQIRRARNRLYERWLMKRIATQFAGVAGSDTPAVRRQLADCTNVREFDETFTAPRNGFADAETYYTQVAGAQFVPSISVPTRMIHAHDDPWIPVESYQDLIGGFSEDTELHLCANGGHVGFHHAGATRAYHDRVLLDFLSALALRT